jgi:serine/threonine protein kinase
MERCQRSLKEDIELRRPDKDYFPSAHLKDIVRPLYKQLEGLQMANFPHRNIKPSNILLNDERLWKFSDTGLVSMDAEGSRPYQAPEIS